jgi:hypothetical protein
MGVVIHIRIRARVGVRVRARVYREILFRSIFTSNVRASQVLEVTVYHDRIEHLFYSESGGDAFRVQAIDPSPATIDTYLHTIIAPMLDQSKL